MIITLKVTERYSLKSFFTVFKVVTIFHIYQLFKYTLKLVNARFKGCLKDDINLVKMIAFKDELKLT